MKISVVAVGTRGDVEPHMALCCGLLKRGHQVKLAAPMDFERQASGLGLNFHPIGVSFRGLYDTKEGAALQACGHRSFALIKNLKKLASSIAGQVFSDIRGACGGADAVCYSLLGMSAYYFAKEMGIPSAITSLQPIGRTSSVFSPLVFSSLRLPRALNRMTHVMVEQVFWQFFRPLMKAKSKTAVPFWGHFNELYRSGSPMLFAYSPSVVPRPDDYQRNMHVTGFWMLPPDNGWKPPAALADFISSGSPPVCVGFGSMNSKRIGKILDAALRAILETGRRAIILKGWCKQPLGTNDLGSDIFVIDDVPHSWLFPRVSAVVHHGGAGTTAAALRAGVPSIVTPFFFDQWYWAQSLHRKGLGPEPISFDRASPQSLKTALDVVERSVPLKQRLSVMSTQLQFEDGVSNAIAILESAWDGKR